MKPLSLDDFGQQCASLRGAWMGLDLGDKTIGVAVTDATRCIASPLKTVKRTRFKEDMAALKEIIGAYGVVGIILGLPINMNGTEGPRVQKSRQFADNFLKMVPMPLTFWDERLSTRGAFHVLQEAGIRQAGRDAAIDKLAASFILEGALAFFRHHM